jgi:hypothetical protein
MGDLGKAMATWVSRVTREVLVAARERGRKGSWAVSLLAIPSYPRDSAQAASAAADRKSVERRW